MCGGGGQQTQARRPRSAWLSTLPERVLSLLRVQVCTLMGQDYMPFKVLGPPRPPPGPTQAGQAAVTPMPCASYGL